MPHCRTKQNTRVFWLGASDTRCQHFQSYSPKSWPHPRTHSNCCQALFWDFGHGYAIRPRLLQTTSPPQPMNCCQALFWDFGHGYAIRQRLPQKTSPPQPMNCSNYLAVSTRTVLESRVTHLASDVRPPRTHAPSPDCVAVSTRPVLESRVAHLASDARLPGTPSAATGGHRRPPPPRHPGNNTKTFSNNSCLIWFGRFINEPIRAHDPTTWAFQQYYLVLHASTSHVPNVQIWFAVVFKSK